MTLSFTIENNHHIKGTQNQHKTGWQIILHDEKYLETQTFFKLLSEYMYPYLLQ